MLYALYNKHPDYEYSALVRSEEKGKPVKKAFADVRLVIGDLDSAEVLEEEAAKADVVIRMFPLPYHIIISFTSHRYTNST